MAIRLLTVLIALGLLHLLPQLAHWRKDGLFRRWVVQLGDTSGAGRVALALLLPLGLCVLALWLLSHLPMSEWLHLLFALALLLYCFGPREFEADLEAILQAPDDVQREAAAQALREDDKPIGWNASELGVAMAYAALRRRFGVLLWFFLLGPIGALLYRLAQTLGRSALLRQDDDSARGARYLANALDWPAAQLLTFTLAIVGHWEAVMGAWRRWHSQAAPTSWYSVGPGFLGAAAQADVRVDMEGGAGYVEEHTDPLAELVRLRSALLRALLTWLSLIALVVIGGWTG